MIRFLIYLSLSWLACLNARAQHYDPYTPQRLPFQKLGLVKRYADTVALTDDLLTQLAGELQQLELSKRDPPAADSLSDHVSPLLSLQRDGGSEWISIYAGSTLGDSASQLYGQWIDRYSGMALDGYTLHIRKAEPGDAVRFALRTEQAIVLYHHDLSLPAPNFDGPTPADQVEAYEQQLRRLDTVLTAVAETMIPPSVLATGLLPGRQLTAAQRTYGLVRFWNEVKYNFAFFNQLPELDWDAQLPEYLHPVQREQSNREYYRLLERLCATLRDGHTNIYPPADVQQLYSRPPVELRAFGEQVVVTNVDSTLVESLPLGTIVLRVNGIPVADYLRDSIYPYLSAGGDHTLRMLGVQDLLKGLRGSSVRIAIELPGGTLAERTLTRQASGTANWVHHRASRPPASFRILQPKIGYLALNTFTDASVVDTFHTYRDQLAGCEGLIIDLRENGGGNSAYGYAILRHFTRTPLLTPAWYSPEHIPAYEAFGQFYSQHPDMDTTSALARESLTAYRGQRWYRSEPDTLLPADTVYGMPVVVLVSTVTASSAENFLVVADTLQQFTYVGEPSFGSTGQPLLLDLPGGGRARICTKRNTYPDGRDYVGPGVQVDVPVQPSVADFLGKRDVVLDRGVEILVGQ
ncbi:S41 family peptidase [Neolewinella sp.]|uniref:S41 family peptidase n=1 Tax=Neolewinella sp. TaxID=2993543 RepID=UPI003B5266E5